MRAIMLSALFALGVGLLGTTGASAAVGAGINNAASAASLLEQTRVVCRRVKVCRVGPYGRRCHWNRVCRRVR
ncbi:MAG: hypothetical protein ACK4UO_16310 [Pseudolabrys sp.]